MVAMTPASRSRRSGCSRVAGIDAQFDVRGQAYADGDTPFSQQFHDGRVVYRPNAVIDAVGPQQQDGVAHALCAARLPGMHGSLQPGPARLGESLRETRTAAFGDGLIAIDGQRDHSGVPQRG